MSNGVEEFTMPTGAKLKVAPAPFADAKALKSAILAELGAIAFTGKDVADVLKNAFCTGFSSPLVDRAMWKCFERCTYDGHKITMDTFEPVQARDDYILCCMRMVEANIRPFLKSLYAEFKHTSTKIEGFQA